jgi:hypothetical protein
MVPHVAARKAHSGSRNFRSPPQKTFATISEDEQTRVERNTTSLFDPISDMGDVRICAPFMISVVSQLGCRSRQRSSDGCGDSQLQIFGGAPIFRSFNS